MAKSLRDIGEFGLIRRLVERLGPGDGVLVGPGDDAAVVASGSSRLLAAADLLVEGSHFDLAISAPPDIGAKALLVNASDIAAMGGRPRYAMLSIGAPADTDPSVLEGIYDGIAEAARATGCAIVGGDTVSAPQLIVSVAILGEPGPGGIVRRDGARAGDALCVTGDLGGAAAGLALLRAHETQARARELLKRHPSLAAAHRRGRARVAEGEAAAIAGARAMIDVSDGLAADVGHLCEASAVRAVIEGRALPLAAGVADVEAWLSGPKRPRADVSVLAVRGGDDYELAMAVPPDAVGALARAIAPTPLTVIGRFEPGSGVEVEGLEGAEFAALGWDHFA